MSLNNLCFIQNNEFYYRLFLKKYKLFESAFLYSFLGYKTDEKTFQCILII